MKRKGFASIFNNIANTVKKAATSPALQQIKQQTQDQVKQQAIMLAREKAVEASSAIPGSLKPIINTSTSPARILELAKAPEPAFTISSKKQTRNCKCTCTCPSFDQIGGIQFGGNQFGGNQFGGNQIGGNQFAVNPLINLISMHTGRLAKKKIAKKHKNMLLKGLNDLKNESDFDIESEDDIYHLLFSKKFDKFPGFKIINDSLQNILAD